MLMPKEQ
jgi:hypothetical protein